MCGPTAAGKSALADELAGDISESCGEWSTTLAVDSMQVYREIPVLTNQARGRRAEMVGIVSVEDGWTVALHKERAERVISTLPSRVPFVLDAGTGMYLNAILLDVPLAPKVAPEVRAEAERASAGARNPRRAAREEELRLSGARERGSIWSGNLNYETSLVYLRPPKEVLDRNIRTRSANIVTEGAEEAARLLEAGASPNPSAREAIGVKEMLLHAVGGLTSREAEDAIAARTRRLARRQTRWFDKLARNLPPETRILVPEDPHDPKLKHIMRDIMGT